MLDYVDPVNHHLIVGERFEYSCAPENCVVGGKQPLIGLLKAKWSPILSGE